MRLATTALVVLLLAGCSSAVREPVREPSRTDPAPAASIPWGDYPPSLQQIIDEDIAAKNCRGLQDSFDAQFASNQSMIDAKGHGNQNVMAYIDAGLKAAGCQQ